MNLEVLRLKLLNLNIELFELMSKRTQYVHKIQEQKLSENLKVFDPKREVLLFAKIQIDLKKLTLKQLFAFSLIIENDASTFCSSYPFWSERVHILNASGKLIEQINPILLKAYDTRLFSELSLKLDFDFINKL